MQQGDINVQKRFSQACENNKNPILLELSKHFATSTHVLEIGSGTGQHSVFFASAMPHLVWQTSDMPDNHPSILAYGAEATLGNWRKPIRYTVGSDQWPSQGENSPYDGIFSANTAHIMQPFEVEEMMGLVASQLLPDNAFCQYGPFKFEGDFTSQSNRDFDERLRSQGYGGYRDIAELQAWAKSSQGDMSLEEVIPMPANNHLLVWRKG